MCEQQQQQQQQQSLSVAWALAAALTYIELHLQFCLPVNIEIFHAFGQLLINFSKSQDIQAYTRNINLLSRLNRYNADVSLSHY